MNPLIRGCFFLGSTALTLAKGVILNQASAAEATSLGLVGVLTTRHTLAQAMRYRRDPDLSWEPGSSYSCGMRRPRTSELRPSSGLTVRFRGQTPEALLTSGAWAWHDMEALRVVSGFGPLRPGISAGMQRDLLDLKTATPLLELRRPVGGANRPQMRKQRAGLGQAFLNLRERVAEVDLGRLLRLLAAVADQPVAPIDVFGVEVGDISGEPPRCHRSW
jgi:hypothetical protein